MKEIRTLGMVLHPRRDSAPAMSTILAWAADRGVTVMGLAEEVGRLDCTALAVSAATMADRADMLVALGGDGTVLRAMRLSDRHQAPVLGVNLGKLGFLAEVDIADLPGALAAIGDGNYHIEVRTALDAAVGSRSSPLSTPSSSCGYPAREAQLWTSPSRVNTSSAMPRTP